MNKLFILLILAIVACSPKVVTFSNSDVERASAKFPGSTLATLTEGHNLCKKYCVSCHPYTAPSARNEAKWNKSLPKMVVNVNKKAHKQVINSLQEASILAYLVTMTNAQKK